MLFHFCYSVYPQNADIDDRNTIGKPALGGLTLKNRFSDLHV